MNTIPAALSPLRLQGDPAMMPTDSVLLATEAPSRGLRYRFPAPADLITIRQAAALSRVPGRGLKHRPSTVLVKIRRGHLRGWRCRVLRGGRDWFVSQSEALALFEAEARALEARGRAPGPTPPPCRHCGQLGGWRGRGLCSRCYHTPGLRRQYPRRDRNGGRAVRDFWGRAPLPPEPTDALPGSPEKLAVLCRRALAGQALHHPDDPRFFPPPPPVSVAVTPDPWRDRR